MSEPKSAADNAAAEGNSPEDAIVEARKQKAAQVRERGENPFDNRVGKLERIGTVIAAVVVLVVAVFAVIILVLTVVIFILHLFLDRGGGEVAQGGLVCTAASAVSAASATTSTAAAAAATKPAAPATATKERGDGGAHGSRPTAQGGQVQGPAGEPGGERGRSLASRRRASRVRWWRWEAAAGGRRRLECIITTSCKSHDLADTQGCPRSGARG